MAVQHTQDIQSQPVESGTNVRRQVLIPSEQGPNFAMRRFVIEPGGSMPNHTNQVEHEQYVLGGRAEIGIGEDVFEVKEDDVVFIPAGAAHWYRNTGSEDFIFLCMVPNKPDQITILE